MPNKLNDAFEILFSKKEEMETFFDYYLFKKLKINKNEFICDKEQFMKFINFSLYTRRTPKNEDIEKGMNYFDSNYNEILQLIKGTNIDKLRQKIYNAQGVGQKIGSLILEIIYLYSNFRNDEIAKQLYVPIDIHVERIFVECFNAKYVPKIYPSNNFIKFQNILNNYTNGKARIYFDYFWFIGKMFCAKTTSENEKVNKGYKLCNYCWIKECCQNNGKWL